MEALGLNANNLKELSFFLLPGLVFIYIFFLQIPDRKKSDLILIFLSVLASSLLNFLTIYIFVVITFVTHLKLDLVYSDPVWLKIAQPYSIYLGSILSIILNTVTNSKLNLTTNDQLFPFFRFLLGVTFAIVSAKLVRSLYFQRLVTKFLKINWYPFGRLWNAFFNVKDKVVRISIDENITYVGYLGRVSTDPNDSVQEVELLRPYRYFRENGYLTRINETDKMLITGVNIISIEMITDEEAKKIYKMPSTSSYHKFN